MQDLDYLLPRGLLKLNHGMIEVESVVVKVVHYREK
ncbi:hypothetical protein J2S10_003014 [Neobacillus ginsengisoli]|uniref:Uncharacterized protein n=1 Tax=Neobacillus ginsengisoli TaxID=904295 RepID=A0ABT9XW96_9BACI|nr:hypothetical protein [Neobacillus ginsengisoli]